MVDHIVLVRHGQTEWSRERRHTGRTDIDLDAEGRDQATQLRAALAGEEFSAVYCSPLKRARETCELAGFGDVMQLDADLQEWDYGRYDGLTLGEIQAKRPGWSLWRDGTDGGESLADVVQRVDRVISRLRAAQGRVLLVAHGHLLRVLAARWLEMPGEAGQRFALQEASRSILGFEHDWTAMRRWNVPPQAQL